MPATDYKECRKCGESKPLEDFYRDRSKKDGRGSYCKECGRSYARDWRRKNPERTAENWKRWHEQNPERMAEWRKQWNQENRELLSKIWRDRSERDREKVKARSAVQDAVRTGKILKPDACEGCAEPIAPSELQGHHPNYDEPLRVVWLCPRCHRAVHMAE